MSKGRWEEKEWDEYDEREGISTATTVEEIYRSTKMAPELDPKGIKFRESCDSPEYPRSRGVMVGADVTGSMNPILEALARFGLKKLATEIYTRRPVSDPHLLFAAIGDVEMGDEAPLQITQFEADIRMAEQLMKFWLEGRGGCNPYESYILLWYFAAYHTKLDCFEKRGEKGYLFTIGDEEPTPYLLGRDIERVFGYKPQFDKITAEELLTIVSRQYEVYHLMAEEGNNFNYVVERKWRNLLGKRAMNLSDHTKMPEVIVSTLQVDAAGEEINSVIGSWDGSTSLIVAKAINSLPDSVKKAGGVVMF